MTIELNREAIARIAALPGVAEAAEAGSALISLWPLTEAMQMDNDAKYAENLQVRVTHAFARILTGQDVTMPDAEFVYEGADKGADVLMDVPVSVAEAALGASVVVPAPDGTKVRVRVPKGTQDDTVLSVRGKGAPKVKGDGSGDLKITVKVVVPKEMNEGQKKAMEDYLAATTDDVRSW